MFVDTTILALISLLALAGLWVVAMMRVWLLILIIVATYYISNFF